MSKNTRIAALLLTAAFTASAHADITEGFEGSMAISGWGNSNQSSPIGSGSGWQIADGSDVGGTHSGLTCAGVDYLAGDDVSTLSVWLTSPVVTIHNGDTLSFWTRTIAASTYPDRLQVRLSTSGGSTNTGTSATDVGDFTGLLMDINPHYAVYGYPHSDWVNIDLTVSGLEAPTDGRFAFRYFVENGGPLGENSNYVAIDDVNYSSVPAPASLAMLGLATMAFGRRRAR